MHQPQQCEARRHHGRTRWNQTRNRWPSRTRLDFLNITKTDQPTVHTQVTDLIDITPKKWPRAQKLEKPLSSAINNTQTSQGRKQLHHCKSHKRIITHLGIINHCSMYQNNNSSN
jgi:hypothetical protein